MAAPEDGDWKDGRLETEWQAEGKRGQVLKRNIGYGWEDEDEKVGGGCGAADREGPEGL